MVQSCTYNKAKNLNKFIFSKNIKKYEGNFLYSLKQAPREFLKYVIILYLSTNIKICGKMMNESIFEKIYPYKLSISIFL